MFKQVKNKSRYKSAQPHYWYIRDRGVNYLFTHSALVEAEKRALKNPEDIPANSDETKDRFMNGFVSGFVVGAVIAITTFVLLCKFHVI